MKPNAAPMTTDTPNIKYTWRGVSTIAFAFALWHEPIHQFNTSIEEKTNAKHTETPNNVYKGTFAPEDKRTQFSSSTKHKTPETITNDAKVTSNGFLAGCPMAGPPANILQKIIPPINKNKVPKYTEKNEFNDISTNVQLTIQETATPKIAPKIAAIPDRAIADILFNFLLLLLLLFFLRCNTISYSPH